MTNYKKLLKILLSEIFIEPDEPEISYGFMVEMICRFAAKEKLVELKDVNWYLTDKGIKLLKLEDEDE